MLNAQHHENAPSENSKERGVFEIIVSGIYAYSFSHNSNNIGSEIHLTYWVNHTWGGGLSYTAKFGRHGTLSDIAIIGSANPAKWITINLGPNFSLPRESRDFLIAAYLESEINIRPNKWFHFGPVLGGVIGHESEVTTGFHLGFEF